MKTFNNIVHKAEEIIKQLRMILKAELNVDIPKIKLMSNKNMTTTLGLARQTGNELSITFNHRAFAGRENTKLFQTIVIHEFCHLADHVVNGYMDGHKEGWQQLMDLFEEPADEFLNVKSHAEFNTFKPYRYKHFCECRTHMLSLSVHRKIMNDQRHFCGMCEAEISKDFVLM